ncbi:MAG: Smr/MutS family protein [Gammaproteobacteria bacterium]|nr:Smr/MutS family protein [Gammaproteobacteria bacterium]
MSSKPPKNINSEDEALFRAAAAGTRPLSTRHVTLRQPPLPAPARKRRQQEAQLPLEPAPGPPGPGEDEAGEPADFRRDSVPRQDFRRLRRGELRAGAEIDLHGLSSRQAHAALRDFIAEAIDERLQCVRVIHGKGLRSGSRGPVLRQNVRHWLRQWDEVLAFAPAPVHDGGSGALHVLLRRR